MKFNSGIGIIKILIFFILFFSTLHADPWGKDSDLINHKNKISTKQQTILASTMKLFIRFHQRVISPVDGPRSHFSPSSSQYMFNAIQHHGFFKGYILGCDRLLRENNDLWVYPTISRGNVDVKHDPVRTNY